MWGDPAAGKAHVEATRLLFPGLLPTRDAARGGRTPVPRGDGLATSGEQSPREAHAPWAAPALRNPHTPRSVGLGGACGMWARPAPLPGERGSAWGHRGAGRYRGQTRISSRGVLPSSGLGGGRVLRVPLPALDLGLEVGCRRGGAKLGGPRACGMGPHEGPNFPSPDQSPVRRANRGVEAEFDAMSAGFPHTITGWATLSQALMNSSASPVCAVGTVTPPTPISQGH